MIDQLVEFIYAHVNPYIATFIISILPVIELRGGIPAGIGVLMTTNVIETGVTALAQPETWFCFLAALLGNMLPVPFLVLFGGQVLRWLAKYPRLGKPFRKILEIGEKKVSKMKKSLFLGLLTFVAIPLPGTGAWTGALISITLGLDLKKSIPPIALGVLVAGIIVLLASTGVVGIFDIFI